MLSQWDHCRCPPSRRRVPVEGSSQPPTNRRFDDSLSVAGLDRRVPGRAVSRIHEHRRCQILGIGQRRGPTCFTAFVVFALFYAVYQYRRQLWQEKVTTDLARALTLTQARLEDNLRRLT